MHANVSGVVMVRGEPLAVEADSLRRLKPSEFIRYAAQRLEESIDISREIRPTGWEKYVAMTLPIEPLPAWPVDEIESTRVLRFLLAAAIAESEGE